jgi:hypothetical protein
MIKLPDNTAVFEIPYEEVRRHKPKYPGPHIEGTRKWEWNELLPDEYATWNIHRAVLDESSDRYVVVATENPIVIQQDLISTDEGYGKILESIIQIFR